MNKRKWLIVGLIAVISGLTLYIMVNQYMINTKLVIENSNLKEKYDELENTYNDIVKKNTENEIIIKQLSKENLDIENKENINDDPYNKFVEDNKSYEDSIINEDLNNALSNDKFYENNNENLNNVINNNETFIDEKTAMINEARNYFRERGIAVSENNGYVEMVGTNLNSGISELEGYRVFAITIENYDIVTNNVWLYYSPDTKVGYKYENEIWTRV